MCTLEKWSYALNYILIFMMLLDQHKIYRKKNKFCHIKINSSTYFDVFLLYSLRPPRFNMFNFCLLLCNSNYVTIIQGDVGGRFYKRLLSDSHNFIKSLTSRCAKEHDVQIMWLEVIDKRIKNIGASIFLHSCLQDLFPAGGKKLWK